MVHVPHSAIHVANTMQGFLNQRKPMKNECYIYLENMMSSRVKVVDTYRLVLSCGFVFELERTFYIPSF